MSATGASKHAPSDSLQSMHLVSKAAGLTALEIGAAFDPFEDQVVVFQHQQSLAAGYEAWVKSEGDRLAKSADGAGGADGSSGRGTGFISLTTLCCGKDKYLLAFRFADYHSTMHWLRSEERKAWASKGESLCTELGHDLAQGGNTFVPDSLRDAVEANFTQRSAVSGNSILPGISKAVNKSERTGCICGASPMGDKPCGRSPVGPPPAWRNVIVIICAASTAFIPCAYLLVPHLYAPFLPQAFGGHIPSAPGTPCTVELLPGASNTTFDIPCGSPPHHTNVMFWGFLLTVFVVNFLVVFFVVPVWNWFCRPFTHGVRRFSECGLNYEPFICLDDGLPCFRPHPAGWEGSVAANEKAIAEATKHLVKLARSQAATRHRLMARLDTMERDLTPAGEYMIKKQKADKLQESVRRRVDSEAAVMVNNRIAREVKGLQKAMSSGSASGQSGASMYIRAYVDPAKQMQAEELLHDITKACYETTPGLLGSIVNLSDVKVGGLLTYDIYVECETAEQLQTWINSDTRRNYLKLGASIFQLPKNVNTVDQMNIHDSVSSLFVQPANMYAAQREQTDTANEGAPFVWHPPTWKMYLAMNVAFTIVGYPMGDLWLLAPDGPLSKLVFADGTPWPLWVKVLINVTILVIVVVYVAVPIVIYYGAHWLFAPWRKSSNPIIAIAEEGLPCCLADGPPPGAAESAEAEPAGVGVELV